MSKPKSWQEMRVWIIDLLERRTGAGLDEVDDEVGAWLARAFEENV